MPSAGRMTIRFSHTPPNFWLGFLLSPFAGAAATAAVTSVWLIPWGSDFQLAAAASIFLSAGIVGFAVSAVCTLVAGGFAALYVLRLRRVPSRAVAVTVALLGGFAPFVAFTLVQYAGVTDTFRIGEAVLLPAVSLAASLSTALAFWRLALRGRQVPPPHPALRADAAPNGAATAFWNRR